jgi:hypothetical protein
MDEPPPVEGAVKPNPRFEPHKLAVRFVSPQAPPGAHPDRVVYGLMQPLLGARTLVADKELLRGALLPAALLAAFCLFAALMRTDGWSPRDIVRSFYQTFAFLAPLPSVLLARYYARLAVKARHKFGFAAAQPCIEPIGYAIKRLIKQSLLVAIGLVPVSIVFYVIPFGRTLMSPLVALWALHWIVVDAFDSARTLKPGQTLAELDAEAARSPQPWFTRLLNRAGEKIPVAGGPLRWFAARCDRLAMPWREEAALIEKHPSLMIGFALTTAALLATPVLNLLFRPIVIIGAAHVLGHLEEPEHVLAPHVQSAAAAPPSPTP